LRRENRRLREDVEVLKRRRLSSRRRPGERLSAPGRTPNATSERAIETASSRSRRQLCTPSSSMMPVSSGREPASASNTSGNVRRAVTRPVRTRAGTPRGRPGGRTPARERRRARRTRLNEIWAVQSARSNSCCDVDTSLRCSIDQSRSARSGACRVRPASVREYSTRTGTSGWTVRLTRPSRSRPRSV
jgi:hypothetical protein